MNEADPVAADRARQMLGELRAARAGGDLQQAHFREAALRLVDLHAVSPDGTLPEQVDGQDFRAAAAGLLADVAAQASVFAGMVDYETETAHAEDDLSYLLVLRSALQYLADDFRGTAADGLIEDESLTDIDGMLAPKVAERGPWPPPTAPKGVPATHWWWRGSPT